MHSLFFLLYTCLATFAAFIVGPLFLFHGRGKKRLKERYGCWNLAGQEVVWLHGASFGEMTGLIPLIKELRGREPDARILVTAASVTGLDRIEKFVDFTRVLPFDHPWIVKKALSGLRIKRYIFTETELWPWLLAILNQRDVPIYLVNGRISDFSLKQYRLIRPLLREIFPKLKLLAASSELDRQRFITLGADPNHVLLVGNTKYDAQPSVSTFEQAQELKRRFFPDSAPVLVLGSLRPGEEKVWFPQLLELCRAGRKLNIVVAPRHQEKFELFANALENAGLQFVRWSVYKTAGSIDPSAFPAEQGLRVVLLDTLGDLEKSYSFADAAFIGGTLTPEYGGHNPMEAAAYGALVIMGPHYLNVRDLVDDLRQRSAVRILSSGAEMGDGVAALLENRPEVASFRAAARLAWAAHAGSSKRILDLVCKEQGTA